MFLGLLKNFKIMGYFQRDIISPRDIIGHKRTLSDRLGAKVTPLTTRGCLYIVCDNFVLKTWKRATWSRKPLTTAFTDVNRLLSADQEAFVFVQREWPREESTRVKQLMPQQGLDPPIKSREVHLESLHLAIDSRFPYENTTVASGGIDMRPRLSVGVMRILPSDWLGTAKD